MNSFSIDNNKQGFSLLELSIVLVIIGIVTGVSMSVGNKQLEQQKVGNSWSELQVIKESLNNYAKRHKKLPCPASMSIGREDATYGIPAADCDSTPTAGVTHYSSGTNPIVKVGGVPFQALGLSAEFASDEWGGRYVYIVDNNLILELANNSKGNIIVTESNGNTITDESAFAVISAGKTGAGSTDDETQAVNACNNAQLDAINCIGSWHSVMDHSIHETSADATFYDDLIVWSNAQSIVAEVATVGPTGTTEVECVAGAGVLIEGDSHFDYSGRHVSGAGDVNGDGYEDVIIGAQNGNMYISPSVTGQAYVIFGKANGWDKNIELASLDGSNGFVITGVDSGDQNGCLVSEGGDVNGDGYDDIIVGACHADPNGIDSGETYVIFGKAFGWPTLFNLSSLDGTNGVQFNGIDAGDLSAESASGAGDINGDGFDDIVIGAYHQVPFDGESGEAYLVFGKSDWSSTAGTFELSTLAAGGGANGFLIDGLDVGDEVGKSVSSAGDVNGDGFDDFLVGARRADPNSTNSGESYLIFGKAAGWSGTFDLTSFDGTNGVQFNGVDANDFQGDELSGIGDINSDGFDDIILGSFGVSSSLGVSYVVFGKADWSSTAGTLELSSLNGTNGFDVNGIDAQDYSAASLSGAGDVNGDGFDDFIVGAYKADPNGSESGESYVIFGKADWSSTSGDFELSSLDGTNGIRFNGIDASDQSGYSVSGAGDMNNDGYTDFIIGAPNAEPNDPNSGESYIIFGHSDWSTTSGVVELSALSDPVKCVSNACSLSVDVDLDANADDMAWNITRSDGKKIIVRDYSASDNNSTETISYALPRGNYSYTTTLTDAGADGFASVADHLEVNGGGGSVSNKAGTAAFSSCTHVFTTDASCGFSNGGSTNMTCP